MGRGERRKEGGFDQNFTKKMKKKIYTGTGMMWNHPLPQGMYFDHPLMHHSEGFLVTYTYSRDSIIQMSLIFPYFQMCPIFPARVVVTYRK